MCGSHMPKSKFAFRNIFITLAVVVIVSLGCVLPFALVSHCDELEAIPEVYVFPNSTVSDQVVREFDRHHRATLNYTVTAERDEVIAFFAERLSCTLSGDEQTTICQSPLESGTGDYFVCVPRSESESTTTYSIEIRWQGCNWDFEMSE